MTERNDDRYHTLLLSLMEYVREEAQQLKAKTPEGLSDQEIGRQLALYSFLNLARTEATVLGLPLEAIGLTGFNPDRDLF
jgi:hypothetical protein